MLHTIVEDFHQLVQHTVQSKEQNRSLSSSTNNNNQTLKSNQSIKDSLAAKRKSILQLEHDLFPTFTLPHRHHGATETTTTTTHEPLPLVQEQQQQQPQNNRSEHAGYNHLSIFASLKTLEQEVSGSVHDYFLWGYAFLAYLLFLCVPVFAFQLVMLLKMSSTFGISFWAIITSSNPLLWLSITYMDPDLVVYWYFLIGFMIIFMLFSKVYYIRYVQMRENDIILHAASSTRSQQSTTTTTTTLPDPPRIFSNAFQPSKYMASNIFTHYFKHKPKIEDHQLNLDPPNSSSSSSTTKDNDYIEDMQLAQDMTEHSHFNTQKIIGRCCSFLIFTSLLIGQLLFTYEFYVRHDYSYQLINGLILTMTLLVINWVWKGLAEVATRLEYHTDITTFYASLIIKNYIFRYASTIITFSISQLQIFLPYSAPSTDSLVLFGSSVLPETNCRFVILTEEYLFLLISEIVQTLLQSVVYPELKARYTIPCSQYFSIAQQDIRQEFSIWQEFLDLNYKEFVLFLAFAPFPSIVIPMSFVIAFELYCDKRKLILHSKPLIAARARFVVLVIVLSLLSFLLALTLVPNGTIFIIYGFNNQCQLLL